MRLIPVERTGSGTTLPQPRVRARTQNGLSRGASKHVLSCGTAEGSRLIYAMLFPTNAPLGHTVLAVGEIRETNQRENENAGKKYGSMEVGRSHRLVFGFSAGGRGKDFRALTSLASVASLRQGATEAFGSQAGVQGGPDLTVILHNRVEDRRIYVLS